MGADCTVIVLSVFLLTESTCGGNRCKQKKTLLSEDERGRRVFPV